MKQLALMLALLFTGCAPYVPAILLPSHPASSEGEPAPTYPASTTLDKQQDEPPNKDTKHKSSHSGHDMNSMSGIGMKGMNHASM